MSYFDDNEDRYTGIPKHVSREARRIEAIEEIEDYDSVYTWGTNDGRTLKPRDMDTSHIVNCLNLMERRGLKYMPTWCYMKVILNERGESNE